jgi:predicted methyltransferase
MRLTEQAHSELDKIVHAGDFVIDATLGNGYDTQFITQKVGKDGGVYAFDIQKESIEQSTRLLEKQQLVSRVVFTQSCHSKMLEHVPVTMLGKIKAVIFNLGYLPGGDKKIITQPESTLSALKQAHLCLSDDGVISLIAYRGHGGGKYEFEEIENLIKQKNWSFQKIPGNETPDSPVLFLIGKAYSGADGSTSNS